jgi:hypothetical protein
MGEVYAGITLVNLRGADNPQSEVIPDSEVRRLSVNAVMNTGEWTLVINRE